MKNIRQTFWEFLRKCVSIFEKKLKNVFKKFSTFFLKNCEKNVFREKWILKEKNSWKFEKFWKFYEKNVDDFFFQNYRCFKVSNTT